MSLIGIISGSGKLPIEIGNRLINNGNQVIFFCIENNVIKSNYKKYNHHFFKLNSIKKIINLFNSYNVSNLILAGGIRRPSIKDIKFDLYTLKFIKHFGLEKRGDDSLLLSIVNFFEKEGFKFIDWKKKCANLFSDEKYLTKKKPTNSSLSNLEKGLNFFKKIGRTDLCQSLIIQNKIILGIEAAEGTDELIKRCNEYKKKGDKGVLIKLSKYNQDTRFDIPVIGLNTVKLIKKYNYEGIFLEKNKLIIIEKDKVIKYCDNNSLFISSVNKN
ncbi:MAG: hypothetical protein CFH19_01185 [Alphaproteobacteria bacterium MarineAlpha5_Bin9]|nr:MAG: hypothetical protein CFH19_01185 [Alphaproteobacteria bacterium MarineAlpha5_Bin9]|tara:strand:- start:12670 stop:13485 length:816 start_codon:yes stop_codon:yes gene_type:complete